MWQKEWRGGPMGRRSRCHATTSAGRLQYNNLTCETWLRRMKLLYACGSPTRLPRHAQRVTRVPGGQAGICEFFLFRRRPRLVYGRRHLTKVGCDSRTPVPERRAAGTIAAQTSGRCVVIWGGGRVCLAIPCKQRISNILATAPAA